MDLSELLTPERICCQSDVQSKKRVLQSLAEMLSSSLRKPVPENEEDAPPESNGTIGTLASKLLKTRPKSDSDDEKDTLSEMGILDAFIARERLGNTALDHGFALPHSRISGIEQPAAAFITLAAGVDYNATDGQKVDLVLGLLVPEQCNDEHLKILATMARRFSDAQFREQIRTHTQPADLYRYVASLDPL